MQTIYKYRILAVVAGLCLFSLPGFCQEEQKESEIGWDDIEDIGSQPAKLEHVSPSGTPRQAQAKQVLPEVRKVEAPAVKTEVKAEVSAEAQAEVPQKAAPAVKKRSSEGKWKRANTITGEDPAANRDIFITNPNRE